MRRPLACLAALALLASQALAQTGTGGGEGGDDGAGILECRVADPTGTPLNVRANPGGGIVGTIGNGRQVEILARRTDERGRAWVLIRQPGTATAIGWVFLSYLKC